ncbi:hypothetical protein [Nonomuraea typhae]|uniref:hypothetical protein n=1 Tax=Nonomuraea typhae TaxID=2603600 RepID=UPI0012FB3073|nr:hypothetical protein [Nonomuraea typhae]
MNVPSPSTAYVDESMVLSHGRYLLVAMLVTSDQADAQRDVLRSLLERGQRRLHWHDENDKRRAHLIEVVAGLRPKGVMVVGMNLNPKKQERARRKCMGHLLWKLRDFGISDMLIERRQGDLDRLDREMIAAMRGCNAMPPGLRPDWCDPESEPLLWLPDIVAGARALAERGSDSFWQQVGRGMRILAVDTR